MMTFNSAKANVFATMPARYTFDIEAAGTDQCCNGDDTDQDDGERWYEKGRSRDGCCGAGLRERGNFRCAIVKILNVEPEGAANPVAEPVYCGGRAPSKYARSAELQ